MTAKVKSPADKWPITTERFVAFIDIMGFKDMVAKMQHEEIYKMMKVIDDSKTINASIRKNNEMNNLVTTTTYSDSIMLYSKDKSYDSFTALIVAVSGLTNDLFLEKIPHKGALAFGTMTLDTERSIFFGQPLIDAYLLQEEMHFYGTIIHGTVEQEMENKFSSTPFIEKFDCPLKNGKSKHYTVAPMHVDSSSAKNTLYADFNKNIISSLNKMRYKTSGHLRRYIDNTEIYFDFLMGKD